jgi:hypothetical protein
VRAIALLWLAGMTAQMAMLDGFGWLWETAYGEPRAIAEANELPLTLLGLAAGGPVALTLVASSIYLALRRARRLWSRALLVVLLTPNLLVAALATHVLLCVGGVW